MNISNLKIEIVGLGYVGFLDNVLCKMKDLTPIFVYVLDFKVEYFLYV
ncbi:hypothetical protein MT391_11650 [Vibrio sp. 1-Bac 57]